MLIYKIFRAPEWRSLCQHGRTHGAPVDLADGFIHFSTAGQVTETATRHFAGERDLTLAAADAARLGPALKWDVSRGGNRFPHLYGALAHEDIAWARALPLHDGAHDFPEPVAGHVDPVRAQFDTFKALPRDHPIEMLNLVRLRDRAAYPPGHDLAEAGLDGAGAYARYGAETAPILRRLGVTITWRGTFEGVLVGPGNEAWDHVFVARYPTAHAFLGMVTDPAYRHAVVHRQAAVATSRLIRCRPAPAGDTFA